MEHGAVNAGPAIDPRLEPIDLIDRVSTRLEHARTIAWAVAEQLERASIPAALCERLSGEISTVYSEIVDAQALVEALAGKCTDRNN